MKDVLELIEYWDEEPPVHVAAAAFFGVGSKYANGGNGGGSESETAPTEEEVLAWVEQAKAIFG